MNKNPVKDRFTIQFEVHNHCNLRCIHCYQPDIRKNNIIDIKGIDWVFDQFEDLIASFDERPKVFFRVSGGEPLIHNNGYLALLYGFFKYNYDTALITNATLIDETAAKKLRISGFSEVQVSFDSAVPEVYERIRGPFTFDLALEGIKVLKSIGKNIKLAVTLLKGINDNRFDELFEFCVQNKIYQLNINRFFPQGQSGHSLEFAYQNDDWKNVLTRIVETASKYPDIFTVIKDPLVHLFFPDLPSNVYADVCCYIGRSVIISYDGSVYACRKLDVKLGNMLDKPLKDIWHKSRLLKQLINREKHLEAKCKECSYLKICKGGCLAASYNIDKIKFKKDPCCCI